MMLNIVNTILCAMIFLLGVTGYKKNKESLPLLIGVAFGLFGVSHLVTMIGFGEAWINFQVVIRMLGYLIVAFALYKITVR